MASSTLTEYYKLSQFQPNDTANWLDDYNPDMQKIDNALHTLSEQTAPLQDQIDALDARLDTEEAQSQLQGEQIVSLQTSINRNNDRVDNMQTKVNSLNGEVDTLQAQVEVLQNGEPSQQQAIERLQQDVADIKTVNDAQATAIAANTTGVSDNSNAIQQTRQQLQDFANIVVTEWTPGPQLTGSLRMLTAWHNLRQLELEDALEFHDISQLEHLTVGDWTSVGYIIATATGKVFNTHAPTGVEEQPNTAENYIGTATPGGLNNIPDSTPTIRYYWHYDVAGNTTYLLGRFPVESSEPTDSPQIGIVTGNKTGGNIFFIAD